jgi:hypothetical protein
MAEEWATPLRLAGLAGLAGKALACTSQRLPPGDHAASLRVLCVSARAGAWTLCLGALSGVHLVRFGVEGRRRLGVLGVEVVW